ncbi:MAG: hypothetical protein ACR2H1_15100 [Limisphaerales bacterium]
MKKFFFIPIIVCFFVGHLSGQLALPNLLATPPNLDQLWTGQARWYLDAQNLGASFGFHYPTMMWQGAEIWAWFIKYSDAGKACVGRARSADGLNWTYDGISLPPGGDYRWTYLAQTQLSHQIGRSDAVNTWSANTAQDGPGFLCYGPYTSTLRKGPNDAGFYLMIDNNSADNLTVVNLDVYDVTTGQILATKAVTRREFTATWTYQAFHLNFYVPNWNHVIEFRTYWYDKAYIRELCAAVAEGYYPHFDSNMASFPGVFKNPTDGMFYMVYEGADGGNVNRGDIGLAMSGDGMTFWRQDVNPILRHNATGWESANIGTPSLYKEGSTWYLYYHGFDYTDCQIGLAYGTDILNLTKKVGNPLIRTVSNTWESGTLGKRSSIFRAPSGLYYLAYEGSTEQPYSTARWSSGLARSQDQFGWDKFWANPVIPQTPGNFGNDGPEMVVINGYTYMYVRSSSGGTDRYRLDW